MDVEKYREFFKNKTLVQIVDAMAHRYGKLPHEILDGLSICDYNFDMAVMLANMHYEREDAEANTPQGQKMKRNVSNELFKKKADITNKDVEKIKQFKKEQADGV